MSTADFAHPEWLGALAWIAASACLALVAAHRVARGRSRRLLGGEALPRRDLLRNDAMLAIALLSIAAALLGPRIGERTVRVSATGVDVVFLLDVSRSMDASDVPPSRLQRARRIVSDLMARLSAGDRAALAAFADHGRLITPLTPDTDALAGLLADLESGVIRPTGSRLDRGVRTALEAFETGSQRARVVVLASDGEDPRGRSSSADDEALRAGVRIVTIAVGSDLGSFVPDEGRPLRLPSGTPVTTRRDTARLAALAAASGGVAIVADEWGRIDGAAAIAEIRRDIVSGGEPVERRVAAIRVAPFAALAFGLLLVEGVPRRGFRRVRPMTFAGIALGIVPIGVAALLGSVARSADPAAVPDAAALQVAEARVAKTPDDARAQLELGLACLEHGRGEAAVRAFLASTVFAADAGFAAVAHYDLGVAYLGLRRLEAAREAFFVALSLDPSDTAARFNLEWTLAAMNHSTPPPAASSRSAAEDAATDSPLGSPEPGAPPASEPARATPHEPGEPASMSAEERRELLGSVADDTRRWLGRGAGEASGTGRPATEEVAW